MEYSLLHHSIEGTPCPDCKAVSLDINTENLLKYFSNQEINCPKCGSKLDWWKLLLRHFEWGVPSYLFSIIGGIRTSAMIYMKPNELFELDLIELGLPEKSRILQIGYTPNGKGLFPAEIHGNVPYRHFIPHKIFLFGRPVGEPVEKTPVAVAVDWVLDSNNNEIWDNLIESVEAFSIKKFQSSVIPANVAVESKLNEIITEYLKQHASSERVKDFLTSGATYSHQLNILLPLIANYEEFPVLPDHIRGSLNELRGYRNKIAHKGTTPDPLEKSTMSKLLCATSFTIGYLHLLEEAIKK